MPQSGTPFPKTTASVSLDASRAIAAFLVCIEHWRNLFFVSYPALPAAHRSLFAVPYVLTDAGHQAVMIFFVLSGYLISGSVFRMGQAFTWRRYLTHRVVRLWIVLLPALLLGAVLDYSGLHLTHAAALYSGKIHDGLGLDVPHTLTPAAFAGNLFFLQGILVHPFGSNGPLWSLANEFWYYLLFPLALIALRPSTSLARRTLSAFLFLAAAAIAGKAILSLFPIWLLGTLLAAIRLPRIGAWLRWPVYALYPLLFFFLAKTQRLTGTLSDYLLGAATFLFLACLLQSTEAAPARPWVRFSRVGASFSYTLYLVHLPLLVLIVALVIPNTRWQPTLPHLLLASLALLAALAYAFAVASLTEFRTEPVRKWIERRILGAGTAPIPSAPLPSAAVPSREWAE